MHYIFQRKDGKYLSTNKHLNGPYKPRTQTFGSLEEARVFNNIQAVKQSIGRNIEGSVIPIKLLIPKGKT